MTSASSASLATDLAVSTSVMNIAVSITALFGVAGMLLVSMMPLQIGGGLSAQRTGMLTPGYAIVIVAFIRV